MLEFLILIDYFISRLWKEEIVESSVTNASSAFLFGEELNKIISDSRHSVCIPKRSHRSTDLNFKGNRTYKKEIGFIS